MRTLIVILTAMLALVPATAHAQRATPTPTTPLTTPAVCIHLPQTTDPSVPLTTCTFPSGTGTMQTVQLDDPTVEGTPLLYIRLRDGTRVWSPVAEQLLPNAWAADNGPIMTTMTGDGNYPRCRALAGIRSYYGAVIPYDGDYLLIAATRTGSSFCTVPLTTAEVRDVTGR